MLSLPHPIRPSLPTPACPFTNDALYLPVSLYSAAQSHESRRGVFLLALPLPLSPYPCVLLGVYFRPSYFGEPTYIGTDLLFFVFSLPAVLAFDRTARKVLVNMITVFLSYDETLGPAYPDGYMSLEVPVPYVLLSDFILSLLSPPLQRLTCA